MISRAVFNRAPLIQNRFAELPLGAIKPEGWLLDQLRVAANGLTGKIQAFWPDVRDSAWRGGDGDAWERGPYYLDGLVPLSYLLEDEKLIAQAKEFIEWTLQSQREDGFFGPESNSDWWPRMVMTKALMQYYGATGDRRVPEFMQKYLIYEYRTLSEKPLEEWAAARGGENMWAAVWLYNLTGKKFLISLLQTLREQTLDWTGFFTSFPVKRGMRKDLPLSELLPGLDKEQTKLTGTDRPYYRTRYHLTHVVNNAMGLKTPGMINMFKSGPKEYGGFQTGYKNLMRYHGVASGMFTGDEHIDGASPRQGTETCAVAELMFTLETLLASGADETGLGDILEKLAFNALPAALSPDNLQHQYLQQVNQVRCTAEKRDWYNNSDDSNLFGLEPNFGCCTANVHQAWPKYVTHLWYAARDDGFACASYAPCTVKFRSGDEPVRFRVRTAYPFEETVRIGIEVGRPKSFPIHLRVPEWAKGATATLPDGTKTDVEPGAFACFTREWKTGDTITLFFPMEPRITTWYHQSAAVEVGPLLMAYQPKENWKIVRPDPNVPDSEVTTDDPWNWAITGENLTVSFHPEKIAPFGYGEAVTVQCEAAPLPEWGMEGGSAQNPPVSPEIDRAALQTIKLVPYGDTSLRIAQFPVAK